MIGEKAVKSFAERLAAAMRATADQMVSREDQSTVKTLRVIASIIDYLIQ